MGGRPASYVDALRGKQIEAAVQAGRQGVDIEIAGAVFRPDRDTERDARKVTQRDPFGREKSTFAEPNEKEWALGGRYRTAVNPSKMPPTSNIRVSW